MRKTLKRAKNLNFNLKYGIINQDTKGAERAMTTINLLEAKARKYSEQHRKAFENNKLGIIKQIGTDEDGNICIKYSNGQWYHYRERDGHLEWW